MSNLEARHVQLDSSRLVGVLVPCRAGGRPGLGQPPLVFTP